MGTATDSTTITECDKAITNLRVRAEKGRKRIRWVLGSLLLGISGTIDLAEVWHINARLKRQELNWMQTARVTVPTYAQTRTPEDDLRNKFSVLMDE